MPSESLEQPLKILITADAVGGVWSYSLELIESLGQSAEVLLATMGPRPSQDQKRQVAALPNVALAESDYALEWMENSWQDVDQAGGWLLDLAHNFGPDVIHLNGYVHAVLPWERPVAVVAHSCVFSWWKAVHSCSPGSQWDEYQRRVRNGLHAADVVLAPSSAMARAVAAEYGLSIEEIRVIHNFSDTEAVPSVQKEPFFLAAGRVWDQAKNIGLLEQIAPGLNWELRISGDGSHGRSSTAVRFLGMLPCAELLDQMAAASVFVHPAFYEPFGLSVLEAARQRCCLVLADIPSLRELWSGAALFINPRDPEQWVRELNGLILDPERCAELGARAFAHAARYSSEATLHQYQAVYRSLVNRGALPSSEAAA